jgi:ferric-dicitrate binding protein FerR (iron transport regulator)
MSDWSVRVGLFVEHHRGKIRRRIRVNVRAGGVSVASQPWSGFKWLRVSAAALMFFLVPGQRAYFVCTPWVPYRAETPTTFVLQDGSTVLLNADTQIKARFAYGAREIILSHGEALFSVAHNMEWPFQVSAGGKIVRAVGTAFSVRMVEPGQVDVLVTQGRVQVIEVGYGSATEDESRRVTMVAAGNEFTVRGQLESAVKLQSADLNRRLAWTAGSLTLRNRNLEDVVREINKYNPMKLEIADSSIAQSVIGGSVVATDPDGFLDALPHLYNISSIRSERMEDGTLIIRLYRTKKTLRRR